MINDTILASLRVTGLYGGASGGGAFAWRPMRAQGNDLGFGNIFIDLVLGRKPLDILCIGSGVGFAPAVLGMAAKTYGGRIDFLDANYGSGVSGWWAFWSDENVRAWRSHHALDNLTFHRSTTKQFFENVYNSGYDLIYIDGDHSFDGVKYDVEQSERILRAGGLIVLHDVRMVRPDNHVGEYWQTVPLGLRTTFMPMPGLGFYAPKGGTLPEYGADGDNDGGYAIWHFPKTS